MDGYELTEKLRQMNKYEEPIIIVSSLTKRVDKARGFQVGADAYLIKPYDENSLSILSTA
jgi:DNA-binding response OmpR family regulator